MKKQLLRVKQIADQTFLRAEKSDALTEDLLIAEKRVDSVKVSCQASSKKISACQIDFGSETSIEKRLKKIPQVLLGSSMLESGCGFSKNSLLGDTLRDCASIQTRLGTDLLEYYTEVEKLILKPISSILENDIHNINKLRKQLGKLVLDMDSARTRFQTAEKHSLQASSNNNFNSVGKVDNLKEELEDASQKVDQCRDTLATEMFSLISKEPQLAQLFVHFHQLQASYHRRALTDLEASLPALENLINNFPQQPVYGCSLEDHLRVTNRDIALVIDTCISFLLEYGLAEEGLLRIAGSATRLKKIKSAFDAGIELDIEEYIRDPHAVAGALKSYLRELPEPLLTTSLYDEWMEAAKLTEFDGKLKALWQVLHKLPETNFKNLRYVIKFLVKLTENMEVNKMSAQNIAIVMAPNLIWSPTEDSSTLGMNMSIAGLHTSIVDLLISYSSWFFPEGESGTSPELSHHLPNLNEAQKLTEVENNETEVNGNNLEVEGSDFSPPSPRSPHRNTKKSTAPPPPPAPSKSLDHCDEISGELIDFFSDCARHPTHGTTDSIKCEDGSHHQRSNSTEIQSKSNENTGDAVSYRAEKPALPDKPSYSTYSLDRKSNRQSVNNARASRACANRTSDPMTRSHVERPSVPPPERPVKVPKFLSSEDLCAAAEPSKSKRDVGEDGKELSTAAASSETTPTADDAVGLQRSRSSSKVNRFDFLVSQKEEKPPERPPRTAAAVPDPVKEAVPEAKVEGPPKTGGSAVFEPKPVPSSSRATEVEKVKPPRPQPPVPTKPKLNVQTENTNL